MQKLDTRKEALLESLVREYVRTAEPVGSSLLAGKAGLDVSAATIRNELAELESAGYLAQPHTSAGRVPTERAYRYFIEHLANAKRSPIKIRDEVRRVPARDEHERLRQAANMLANEASECVFVSFGDGEMHIAGFGTLFSKPEFNAHDVAKTLGAALDHLQEMVQSLTSSHEPRALIGSDNPLHRQYSVVYASPGTHIRIGFFGPMRMDYEREIGLLQAFNDAF
jgi:heat-inducible transcriptional repressor